MIETAVAETKLAIIGCGTMGKCFISALLDSKTLTIEQIRGTVHHEETLERIGKQFPAIRFGLDNLEAVNWANTILICLKPQSVEQFLINPAASAALKGKIVISIAAGIRLAQYEQLLPDSHVIRAMPNTPCKIREGMIALSASPSLSQSIKKTILALFSPLGRCRFLSDRHMDAVTALGGSGPAFACIILEALADGGVMMGLARDVAVELAAQSLQGAARMVLETGQHPAQIKDAVTTPGGCTIAGILTMEDGKIRSVLARTIEEATKVASTLGNVSSKN